MNEAYSPLPKAHDDTVFDDTIDAASIDADPLATQPIDVGALLGTQAQAHS